jgi:hypothetical protein
VERLGTGLLHGGFLRHEREIMAFEKPTAAQLENRFVHHLPKGDQAERYAAIRSRILDVATFCVARTPCSPEQTRALNALDDAMMLFNSAIARNE